MAKSSWNGAAVRFDEVKREENRKCAKNQVGASKQFSFAFRTGAGNIYLTYNLHSKI